MDAHRAIERSARDSYGRLLSYLASRTRDLAAAEDALADAFQSALETWPGAGVPENPDAWLLTAARRRLIDASRRDRIRSEAAPTLIAMAQASESSIADGFIFPDERLKLMFLCAHPAIDPAARTPLMLQTVLGLDAGRIASAFLVRPSAMSRRLTRAKVKIRDARISFDSPEAEELPSRLEAVLEAIYAAYGSGWDDLSGSDPKRRGLSVEAIDLGELVVSSLPGEPEALGLLALMLHCEARRPARRDAKGAYIPLSDQDTTLWSTESIVRADWLLRTAERAGRIGRFQLEAAIQSVHARRVATGRTDWETIALLYEGLIRIAPTIGALVGRAAAVAEARDALTAWALLGAIPVAAVAEYQPYWALAARLLALLNRFSEARAAYGKAIGLCEDRATRDFLVHQMQIQDDYLMKDVL